MPNDYDSPVWTQAAGPTVFAPFPADTDYFGRPGQAWMLNLRVRDLDMLLSRLKAAGIAVPDAPEVHPNGRLARIHDPEGNPIELWEPDAGKP